MKQLFPVWLCGCVPHTHDGQHPWYPTPIPCPVLLALPPYPVCGILELPAPAEAKGELLFSGRPWDLSLPKELQPSAVLTDAAGEILTASHRA